MKSSRPFDGRPERSISLDIFQNSIKDCPFFLEKMVIKNNNENRTKERCAFWKDRTRPKSSSIGFIRNTCLAFIKGLCIYWGIEPQRQKLQKKPG